MASSNLLKKKTLINSSLKDLHNSYTYDNSSILLIVALVLRMALESQENAFFLKDIRYLFCSLNGH